jgi:alanyl-tRNA synthetase
LPGDAIAKVEAGEPLKTSGEARGNIIEVEAEERGAHHGSTGDDDDDFPVATASAEQIALDIAFRVIADHIRTLSFAIADGIQPGNTDRNYVLRRILRRAVRYGRTLGFREPFFYKLVDVLAETMGDVFPEIRAKRKHVQDVIRIEEESFNKTLDTGINLFERIVVVNFITTKMLEQEIPAADQLLNLMSDVEKTSDDVFRMLHDIYGFAQRIDDWATSGDVDAFCLLTTFNEQRILMLGSELDEVIEPVLEAKEATKPIMALTQVAVQKVLEIRNRLYDLKRIKGLISGEAAFKLYDTYGFPLDLTELMARERGLTVDKEGFEKLMEEQRKRSQAAQKKTVITLQEDVDLKAATKFVGYEQTKILSRILTVIPQAKNWGIVLETSPFYAEMGGQVGDTGIIATSTKRWIVVDTKKIHQTWLHIVEAHEQPINDNHVEVEVNIARRNAIQRHHTVTHLLHWALHEVASKEATQKGSFVGPDKLTFDFNSAPLTPAQIADIEKLVNERIVENAPVTWMEVKHNHVKDRKDVMQFFGDKYGEWVRVVQIGGKPTALDGYSMELCGGTHVRATGEIGLFRIIGESAIAAGVRRIEAVAGLTAYDAMKLDRELIKTVAGKLNAPIHELDKKIESLLAHQKALEKEIQIAMQRNASNAASELLGSAQTVNDIPLITHNLGDANGDFLQAIADALKSQFKGVVVLGGGSENSVTLIATVSSDFTAKVQAGKIIQAIAPIVCGKGGGKPDNARGGGKDASKLDEALAKAKSLLG